MRKLTVTLDKGLDLDLDLEVDVDFELFQSAASAIPPEVSRENAENAELRATIIGLRCDPPARKRSPMRES
jgi:hypothetical protein